jgi:hypothetical protein
VVDAGYLAFSFVAAIATAAVGAWVFFVDPGRRLNRVFALFLVLRGLRGFVRAMTIASPDPAAAAYWGAMRAYFDIAATPVLVYFAIAYLVRNRNVLTLSFATTLVLVVGTEWGFAQDHCLERCGASGLGPLSLLTTSAPMVTALAGLLFALDALRRRGSPEAVAATYASVGLTLVAFLDSSAFLAYLVNRGVQRALDVNGGGPYVVAFIVFDIIAWFAAIAATACWQLGARGGHAETRRAWLFSYLAAGVLVSGIAIEAVDYFAFFTDFITFFLVGLWRFALPVFVGYAVLRHQLFNLDWRVRLGLERGALGAVALASFFLVGQLLELLLNRALDADQSILRYLGAAGVGIGVLLLHPMQRLANRWADRAMPQAKDASAMTAPERIALYREHARIAWEDGVLQRKERILLDHLRERLAIPIAEAYEIERAIFV